MENRKILIIDFDPKTLTSLSHFLQEKGFSVFTASDGERGLETYLNENPDLIIMEPMLPKIHGFDLCAKIKEETDNGIPIIIGTSIYQENQCKREVLHSFSRSAFIKKPYTNEEMFALIQPLITPSPSRMPETDHETDASAENTEPTEKAVEVPQEHTDREIDEQINKQLFTAIQSTEKKEKKTEVKEDIDMLLKDTLSEFGLDKKAEASERESKPQKLEEELIVEELDVKEPSPAPSIQEEKKEKELSDTPAIVKQDSVFGEYHKKKTKLVPALIILVVVIASAIAIYALFFRSPTPPNTLQASEAQLSGSIFQQANENSEIRENSLSPESGNPEMGESTPPILGEQGTSEEENPPNGTQDPGSESGQDPGPAKIETPAENEQAPPEPPQKKAPTIEYEDPEISPSSLLPELQKALQSDVRDNTAEETYAIKPVTASSSSSSDPQEQEAEPLNETAKMGDLVPLTIVDTEPEAVQTVQPKYPPSARAFNVEGQLVVNALISENGDVLKTIIIRGIKNSQGLNEAGEKAIQQWKFKPAMKDGVPVKVWKPISIAFRKEK
jgi:TonB family protein